MGLIDQLDKAIRALRRPRKPSRVARANAYAARLRAASSEGERDLVRAELAGLRRGGKRRDSKSRSPKFRLPPLSAWLKYYADNQFKEPRTRGYMLVYELFSGKLLRSARPASAPWGNMQRVWYQVHPQGKINVGKPDDGSFEGYVAAAYIDNRPFERPPVSGFGNNFTWGYVTPDGENHNGKNHDREERHLYSTARAAYAALVRHAARYPLPLKRGA